MLDRYVWFGDQHLEYEQSVLHEGYLSLDTGEKKTVGFREWFSKFDMVVDLLCRQDGILRLRHI